jgi:predicted dinucleotide-binding enzyme
VSNQVKIAVLGSGNIGSTLGAKWITAGHKVAFGVRNPTSAKTKSALSRIGAPAKVDTIENAIRFADVVVLAIPANAVEEMMAEHGAKLNGKIVIDTTNRFGASVVNNIAPIAAAAPRATIYRAFNSLGWENFAEPVIDGEQLDLFYCGPEGESLPIVEHLIADIGLRPVRVGGIETAPIVDSIGSLWVTLVFGQHKGRRMGFRLLGG